MTSEALLLRRLQRRLGARLAELDECLGRGEDLWPEVFAAMHAWAAFVTALRPEAGAELTTRQMAERFGVSTKTLRRRAKRGEVTPIRYGKRGPAALRWKASP